MDRLGRLSQVLGMLRPRGKGGSAWAVDATREIPFRHKLMLALALEILVLGFRQSETLRQHKGIVVEAPSHPGNAIV
jgi:hypothetical protein